MLGTFGPYHLLRRIGIGGMAEVFVARKEGKGPLLVVKRVHSHLLEEEYARMFFDEARIVGRISHQNVVRTVDMAEHEGRFGIVLEYVDGCDLRALRRLGPIPLGLSVSIAAQAAAGLHAAHTCRDSNGRMLEITHLDVSPHNILIGRDGVAKVADFGIARFGSNANNDSAPRGKVAYMSPEQLQGKQVNHRADQFALAVILWELLTHRRAFDGESDFQIFEAVLKQKLPGARSITPEVPAALDSALMIATSKKPEDRFPDCAAFRQALMPFVDAQLAAFLKTQLPPPVQEEEEVTNTDPVTLGAINGLPVSADQIIALRLLRDLKAPFGIEDAESVLGLDALDRLQELRDTGWILSEEIAGEMRFRVK